MAALFMSGFEDDAAQLRCGELCVFEIFGNALGPPERRRPPRSASGIKAFRDPALTQDFDAPRLPIDVTEPHLYAVDWDADEAVFTVDGEVVRRCAAPADVPAPADDRRLRLPGVVGRRRRPPGAAAGRRPRRAVA